MVFVHEGIVIKLCILLFLYAIHISDMSLSSSRVLGIRFLIWSSTNSLIITKIATLLQVRWHIFHKESRFISLPQLYRQARWEFDRFGCISWFLLNICPLMPPNQCTVNRLSIMLIILLISYAIFWNRLIFALCPTDPASFIDCTSNHAHLQKWKYGQIVSKVNFQFFRSI